MSLRGDSGGPVAPNYGEQAAFETMKGRFPTICRMPGVEEAFKAHASQTVCVKREKDNAHPATCIKRAKEESWEEAIIKEERNSLDRAIIKDEQSRLETAQRNLVQKMAEGLAEIHLSEKPSMAAQRRQEAFTFLEQIAGNVDRENFTALVDSAWEKKKQGDKAEVGIRLDDNKAALNGALKDAASTEA